MDSAISFALTDYRNGERHLSAKQGQDSVDIYYLKGAVLIKGYSEAQIKQFAPNTLFMMPATFAVPISILAEAALTGPCNLGSRTPVSKQFSGATRLQDRKRSKVLGQILSSAPGAISYELDVSIEPPFPDKASIRYSGAMTFAPLEDTLPEGTDLTGYLLVTRSPPFPVIGSSAIPIAKLGELRQLLASRQTAPNPTLQTDAPQAARL